MKFRMLMAVSFLMIVNLGFTWFQPQQEKKNSPSDTGKTGSSQVAPRALETSKNEPSKSVKAAVLQAESSVNEAVRSVNRSETASAPQVFSDGADALRQVQSIQSVPAYKSPAAGVGSSVPSPVSIPIAQQDISPLKDLEVVKIQKQINEIIETNEKFKSLQQAQTDQIRQITEQAQMHRRMLQDLEEKNKSPQNLKADDVDEILRQEKMRIIENETEQNKLLLDQLASQQGTAGTNS